MKRQGCPKEILESAIANGWRVTESAGGRLRWEHPPTGAIVYSSKFSGGGRGWQNHRAALQRAMTGKAGPIYMRGGPR
jgi:hypothetical protein